MQQSIYPGTKTSSAGFAFKYFTWYSNHTEKLTLSAKTRAGLELFFFLIMEIAGPASPSNICDQQKQPSQDISRTPGFHLSGVPLTNQQLLIEKRNRAQLSSSALSHAGTCNSVDNNLELKTQIC